ncbi:hypothetical protein JOQ06_025067, partial [Pogonophryne albipinna]
MDEAAAEIREDGAENKTHDGDTTSENNVDPSAEDTADGVGVFCCRDCGEAFREEAAFLEHRHQHPQESISALRIVRRPQQSRFFTKSKTLDNERKETKQEQVTSENVPPISVVEEDSHANESDEDLDSYDPGDFIVQVISASESEDEAAQDTNPDLELLCESDQENKNEGDTGVSPMLHHCAFTECGMAFVRENSRIQQCSSTEALFDHKKVCHEMKEEKIQTPETVAEVSPPLSRLSEHMAKCLFKCDKCGKAFQTEEHLGTHKTKAKSRPYCCALCCIGFWSENQLQQHLAWHDEVRCRLPNE